MPHATPRSSRTLRPSRSPSPSRKLRPSRRPRPERVTMADVSSRRYVSVRVTTLWSSPTSRGDVDAAAVAPHPDVVAWLADLDAAAARRGLHGRALTQLELGEPVDIIDDPGDGWIRVVAPMQPSTLDPVSYTHLTLPTT